MTPSSSQSSASVSGAFSDRFGQDVAAGRVIGTGAGEVRRGGIDVEGVIGIDHGALRIGQMVKSGWGRCGLSYGPYVRRNGLAFAVHLLNGHNTSQAETLPDTFLARLGRWLRGSEARSPLQRLRALVRARRNLNLIHRFRQWFRLSGRVFRVERLDQNLAIGWFPAAVPRDPTRCGSALIMHATGPECGELRCRSGLLHVPAVRGVQNVPLQLIIVLREVGAACYAASLPGVPGMAAFSRMRLIGVDASGADPEIHAGIHQSVLGQIGFRVDSRVYSAAVADLPGFEHWYGSAHAADRLRGEGPPGRAETGGSWIAATGNLERTPQGARPLAASGASVAWLDPGRPSGFVRLDILTAADDVRGVGLIWRADGERSFVGFETGTDGSRLVIREDDVDHRFPLMPHVRLARHRTNSLQVVDDGREIRVFLNDVPAFAAPCRLEEHTPRTGVGIILPGTAAPVHVTDFEAHPRDIPLPAPLEHPQAPYLNGATKVIDEDFSGPASPLDGREIAGPRTWTRMLGQGRFEVTGTGGVRVVASPQQPCPGRTVFTVPWQQSDFADLEITMTPPGPTSDGRDRGRGGLVFWQDADNHIVFNLWMDSSYGFSISSFYCIDGFEEIYDAVWTNIGSRVSPGVPFRLRVSFDGLCFLGRVDGEPVLYRSLTDIYPGQRPLAINRVGLLANWEWGNDTGTVFHRFVARSR